jgi:hypothetical protein
MIGSLYDLDATVAMSILLLRSALYLTWTMTADGNSDAALH